MIGVCYYLKVYFYTYVNDCIHMYIFYVYILSFVFLSLKLYMNCLILQKKNLYIYRILRVCCERTWFLVFEERCPPQPHGGNPIFVLSVSTIEATLWLQPLEGKWEPLGLIPQNLEFIICCFPYLDNMIVTMFGLNWVYTMVQK